MAGEQRTYFFVKFEEKRPHELPNGRTIQIDSPKYYIKKNSEGSKPHEAVHLTQELAQQIIERYPGRNGKIEEDREYVYDQTPSLKAELFEVGEVEPPPKPAPSSVQALEDAVRNAIRDLPKLEVITIVNRIILGESV
jgi:hypothetical protein